MFQFPCSSSPEGSGPLPADSDPRDTGRAIITLLLLGFETSSPNQDWLDETVGTPAPLRPGRDSARRASVPAGHVEKELVVLHVACSQANSGKLEGYRRRLRIALSVGFCLRGRRGSVADAPRLPLDSR